MKLTLQHFNIRSTDRLDTWVESRIFSLQPRLQIDEATVRLACWEQGSPAYEVRVHLVTPGPDVVAEGRDHTLRAAFVKVMAALERKIDQRSARRAPGVRARLVSAGGRGAVRSAAASWR